MPGPLGTSRPLSSLAFASEARTQWVVVGCGPPRSAATQTMDLDVGTVVPDRAAPLRALVSDCPWPEADVELQIGITKGNQRPPIPVGVAGTQRLIGITAD